jgi:cytochrome b pre-mRNA-processing protein 3
MGLGALFKRRDPVRDAGAALYESAVAQARQPALYAGLGLPDTVEGRFEAYALHLALLLRRLRREGSDGAALGQALFDRFLVGLDDGLRQMGISDTGLAKRMKTVGQAVYGRLNGYETAFAELPDMTALEGLAARTAFAGEPEAQTMAAPFARYAVAADAALTAQPLAAIQAGEVAWPEIET